MWTCVLIFLLALLLDRYSFAATFVWLESITLSVMPNGSIFVSPNHNCCGKQHTLFPNYLLPACTFVCMYVCSYVYCMYPISVGCICAFQLFISTIRYLLHVTTTTQTLMKAYECMPACVCLYVSVCLPSSIHKLSCH